MVNLELGVARPQTRATPSCAPPTRCSPGKHDDEFPLVVWQTGSGTQTNMNVNEVLANRASELLGGERGDGRKVHPNDDVNKGQSSNDVFPTAMHVAAVAGPGRQASCPRCARCATRSRTRRRAFADIVKIGRTHLQDATPLTLGQEFCGLGAQLDHGVAHFEQALPHLRELALGGTAVGTGLNAHHEFAERVAAKIARAHRPAVRHRAEQVRGARGARRARRRARRAQDARRVAHEDRERRALARVRAALRASASSRFPENEPGSSIMPGKVNPTQCEAMTMLVRAGDGQRRRDQHRRRRRATSS